MALALAAGPPAGPGGAHPGLPPHVSFTPLANLAGFHVPDAGGWSPTGSLLALQGPDGYYVLDAARIDLPPRQVLGGAVVRSFSWSPDGKRLLFVVGDPNPQNLRTLLVVSAADGHADTLLANAPVWPAVWGSDGGIYYPAEGGYRRIEPLAAWQLADSVRARRAPSFILGPDSAFSGSGLARLTPGADDHPALSALNPGLKGRTAVVRDQLWATGRYLVLLSGPGASGPLVLGAAGERIADLGWTGMAPTSITPDGRLAAGARETFKGGVPETSTILLADVMGHWCVPVGGSTDGNHVQLARADSLLAYQELANNSACVGRFRVRAR
jgi:hypothetical protein